MPHKSVLKVWCLPMMSEEELNALHKSLVAATKSIKGLGIQSEDDLITLFPADIMKKGLGSVVFVEYDDVADYWQRRDELEALSSKLGNAVKRHIPAAFVQCETRSGDARTRYRWTSEQSTTCEEVARVQAVGVKLLPKFQKDAGEKCYCESNATDHKGPCGYCNTSAAYRHVVTEGTRVLAIADPTEFQAAADIYVQGCRSTTYYEELHRELGWQK